MGTPELKMADFSYDVTRRAGSAELALAGELDMSATFRLEPAIDRLIASGDVSELVLDLGGLHFIDSSGIGLLLTTHDRSREADVRMSIRPGRPETQRVLRLAGVEDTLPFRGGG
jgi:stage II sporulation protein AA (anti-sigma F factor antagonist)